MERLREARELPPPPDVPIAVLCMQDRYMVWNSDGTEPREAPAWLADLPALDIKTLRFKYRLVADFGARC